MAIVTVTGCELRFDAVLGAPKLCVVLLTVCVFVEALSVFALGLVVMVLDRMSTT